MIKYAELKQLTNQQQANNNYGYNEETLVVPI